MATRSLSAYSGEEEPGKALIEICDQIDSFGKKPVLIVFFSNCANFEFFSKEIADKYFFATVIGASSGSIISTKGFSFEGVAALAVYDRIECYAGVIPDASGYPMKFVDEIRQNAKRLSTTNNSVCMEFTTCVNKSEELIQDALRTVLEPMNIPVFGSSTGLSEKDVRTAVSLNGRLFYDGCVYAFIHNMNGRIILYQENMYKPSSIYLTATDVECEQRLVYEFNDKPAARILADEFGVPVSELKEYLASHPLGRVVGDKILITDVADVNEDDSVSFYSRIYNRTRLVKLEPEDYHTVWAKTKDEIAQEELNAEFSLVVNCFSRACLFMKNGIYKDFIDTLEGNYGEFVGVSGMGEQFGFEHLNQTMILALFE